MYKWLEFPVVECSSQWVKCAKSDWLKIQVLESSQDTGIRQTAADMFGNIEIML
jgi:hypothetical protein